MRIKAGLLNFLIWAMGVIMIFLSINFYKEYPTYSWKGLIGWAGITIGMTILRFWRVKHDIIIKQSDTIPEAK